MRTKNFIFLLALVILLSILLIVLGPSNNENIANIQNLANKQFRQIKVSHPRKRKFMAKTNFSFFKFQGKPASGKERKRIGSRSKVLAVARLSGRFHQREHNARFNASLQHHATEFLNR